MNFAFSDEQEQLRDAVRRFLEAKSPSTEVRRLMETTEGYDPAVWAQMANEPGLQSLDTLAFQSETAQNAISAGAGPKVIVFRGCR